MALFLHGQVSCNSYFNTDKSSLFQGAHQSPYQGPFYSARHLSLIKTFLPLICQAVNHSLTAHLGKLSQAEMCQYIFYS